MRGGVFRALTTHGGTRLGMKLGKGEGGIARRALEFGGTHTPLRASRNQWRTRCRTPRTCYTQRDALEQEAEVPEVDSLFLSAPPCWR